MSDYNRGQLDLINSLLNLDSLRNMSPENVRLMLKNVRAVIQEEAKHEEDMFNKLQNVQVLVKGAGND